MATRNETSGWNKKKFIKTTYDKQEAVGMEILKLFPSEEGLFLSTTITEHGCPQKPHPQPCSHAQHQFSLTACLVQPLTPNNRNALQPGWRQNNGSIQKTATTPLQWHQPMTVTQDLTQLSWRCPLLCGKCCVLTTGMFQRWRPSSKVEGWWKWL